MDQHLLLTSMSCGWTFTNLKLYHEVNGKMFEIVYNSAAMLKKIQHKNTVRQRFQTFPISTNEFEKSMRQDLANRGFFLEGENLNCYGCKFSVPFFDVKEIDWVIHKHMFYDAACPSLFNNYPNAQDFFKALYSHTIQYSGNITIPNIGLDSPKCELFQSLNWQRINNYLREETKIFRIIEMVKYSPSRLERTHFANVPPFENEQSYKQFYTSYSFKDDAETCIVPNVTSNVCIMFTDMTDDDLESQLALLKQNIEKINIIKNHILCKICGSESQRLATDIIQPCGHMPYCSICSKLNLYCFICHKPINTVLPTKLLQTIGKESNVVFI